MFKKNDNEFICIKCGQYVKKLKYTSRDHCNHCLYSLHVDVTPGDRQNECRGILQPVNVILDSKKGKVIIYKCQKCGQFIKNVVAKDDSSEIIYEIIENYAKKGSY